MINHKSKRELTMSLTMSLANNNTKNNTKNNTIGVLLVNLGTPDAPTKKAVKIYLKEFLSDPRVIEIPKILWQIILRGIILNTRPKKSAEKYKKVWTEKGSPLLAISQEICTHVAANLGAAYNVKLGMRYGYDTAGVPSIFAQLDAFQAENIEHVIVLPLYPQYCAATTASVFDKISAWMIRKRNIVGLTFIKEYYQHPLFIKACTVAINEDLAMHKQPQKLIFSYHGMPEVTFKKGDPYYTQCLKTTELIINSLDNKSADHYQNVFQSRFGAQAWLKPYAYQYLNELPKQGVDDVAVFCPGFSADCLETLEEMALDNKSVFIQAGGKNYRYISALNTSVAHIDLLATLIKEYTPTLSSINTEIK